LCPCYCPLARIFHNADNSAKGGLRPAHSRRKAVRKRSNL
jgi:hypothetical protein